MATVRIELDIFDELEELKLPANVLLAPVSVWFTGSSTRDIAIEFEVEPYGEPE
jgi:hypothetical protein